MKIRNLLPSLATVSVPLAITLLIASRFLSTQDSSAENQKPGGETPEESTSFDSEWALQDMLSHFPLTSPQPTPLSVHTYIQSVVGDMRNYKGCQYSSYQKASAAERFQLLKVECQYETPADPIRTIESSCKSVLDDGEWVNRDCHTTTAYQPVAGNVTLADEFYVYDTSFPFGTEVVVTKEDRRGADIVSFEETDGWYPQTIGVCARSETGQRIVPFTMDGPCVVLLGCDAQKTPYSQAVKAFRQGLLRSFANPTPYTP